jgi:hypothetical protein
MAKRPHQQKDIKMEVYKDWLKVYLDYYNLGYYEFLDNGVLTGCS